ncbi:hypothetical protein, partial [Streptomyces sp. CBMA156]|uniref:hypothetical protein n=1 Tax=Streptomyces sp. CBMA156 TaxID=1930280 RepID=UPI001D3966C1|nr:hypothetical protein [Streptomyces sp. CBMA156]
GGFLVTAELPLRTGARDEGPEAVTAADLARAAQAARTARTDRPEPAEGQDRTARADAAVREDRDHA